MNKLNEINFNRLTIDEVFIYYDEPKFYRCHFHTNQKYIALCIEENKSQQVWFYVKIEDPRYNQMINNQVSLYDVFKFSENGILYKVIVNKNDKRKIEIINTIDILDKYLPNKNCYLYENDNQSQGNI